MGDDMTRVIMHESDIPHGAEEVALRLALEEARHLAAQTRLLALNAALEAAAVICDANAPAEMDALGRSAGQAMAETDRIVSAMELRLQQIQSSPALSGPL